MGFPKNSRSSTNFNKRNRFSTTENRPRMLKDFLLDDSNSSSSGGLNSFPRKPLDSTTSPTSLENDLIKTAKDSDNAKNLSRKNYSKPNSFSNKISALQAAVISAVKSVKSPSILPRSLSRKLSKRSSNDNTSTPGSRKQNEEEIAQVKVKDIIRWTSFRDLVEEESPPLDCTATTSGSSNASSWSDSDFSTTSEYLPSCMNNGDDEVKSFSPCVGGYPMEPTTTKATHAQVGPPKGEEEKQQQLHSPISVIDFNKLEEDEDRSSPINQSFANVEKTKHELMERIRRFESLAKLDIVNLENWKSMEETTVSEEEEGGQETNDYFEEEEEEDGDDDEVEKKAWELLNRIRGATALPQGDCKESAVNKLLLDFFRDELANQQDRIRDDDDQVGIDKISNRAKAWMNGQQNPWMGWGVEDKRKDSIKDMERGPVNWSKFQEEQEEFAFAIGNETVGLLVDELLLDLLMNCFN